MENQTASKAIALAIADHRAGPLTDWTFVDALRKAQERCNDYPQLVAALRGSVDADADTIYTDREARIALLRSLGESE